MKENNLPVLDNINLRKRNTEQVVNAISNVGGAAGEGKKTARAMKWYIWLIIGFVVVAFSLTIIKVYVESEEGEFMDNLFFIIDENDLSMKINCYNQNNNATLRSFKDAIHFKELFENSTCIYYSSK